MTTMDEPDALFDAPQPEHPDVAIAREASVSASAGAVLVGGPGDGQRRRVPLDRFDQPPATVMAREALQVRALEAHVRRGAAYVPPRTGVYRLHLVDGVPAVDGLSDLVYAWAGWETGPDAAT